MGTNTNAPQGLLPARNRFSGSPTFQAAYSLIKKGYASNIGIGDLVITSGPGANQGYLAVATGNETQMLGVFAGIGGSVGSAQVPGATGGGYFDNSLQTYVYGLNGSYPNTANPTGDIAALVYNDPGFTFRAQLVNGAWTQSLMGQNINFLAGSNGAPNNAGLSTLALDFNTLGNGNQLPFRIIGLFGVVGGPQDPTNTNPWIEVALNTSEMLQGTGL